MVDCTADSEPRVEALQLLHGTRVSAYMAESGRLATLNGFIETCKTQERLRIGRPWLHKNNLFFGNTLETPNDISHRRCTFIYSQ
jgi:hypothetical protein